MPQLAAGNVIQLTVVGQLHEQTILNVFNFRLAASVDPPDPPADVFAAVATEWFASFQPSINTRLSVEYTIDHVRIQDVYPTRYVHHAFDPGPGSQGAGQVAGNSLPTSVAIVTTLTTELAGASHRGRKFWGGIPVTSEADSAVEPTVLQDWRDVVDLVLVQDLEVIVAANTYTLTPIIWSGADPTGKDDITGALTQRVLRTQRRRQLGRGI